MSAVRTDTRRFFEVSGPTPLSGPMRLMLENERGVSFADASDLRMLATAGTIGDRPVTFFRIFDLTKLPSTEVDVRSFDDLTEDLRFCSGHLEADNTIVLAADTPRVLVP